MHHTAQAGDFVAPTYGIIFVNTRETMLPNHCRSPTLATSKHTMEFSRRSGRQCGYVDKISERITGGPLFLFRKFQ